MRISDWSSDVCSSDLREQKQDQRLSRVAQKEVGEPCGKQQRQHRLAKHLERNPPWRALLLPRKLVRPIPVEPLTNLRCGQTIQRALNKGFLGHMLSSFETRSEEHTSELQSLMRNSYAVFCLKKTK